MCYEFSSWHWKARAKELHKAQVKVERGGAESETPAQAGHRDRAQTARSEGAGEGSGVARALTRGR